MPPRAGSLVIAAVLAAATGGACGAEPGSAGTTGSSGGGGGGGQTPFLDDCQSLGLSGDDCRSWSERVLPVALPAARGNRFGDDDDAAALGYALFFDLDALSPAARSSRR